MDYTTEFRKMQEENQSLAKPGYYAIIPADVRYDQALSPSAKLLYAEVTSLSNKKGYCWAPNEYFAALFGCSVRTVQRMLRQLESRGYIRCEMVGTDTGSERRIYAGLKLAQPPEPAEPDAAPQDPDAAGDTGGDSLDAGGGDTPVTQGGDRPDAGGGDNSVAVNNVEYYNRNNIPPCSPPKGDHAAKTPGKPRRVKEHYRPDWFEAFWAIYPRKDKKQVALASWDRLKPDRATCVAMREALERDKHSRQWTKDGGEFIPLPSTWLNQRRWEDQGVDLSLLAAPAWAPDPEVI